MQVTVVIIVIIIINLRTEVNKKCAVLCKSLPYFVCIKLSFKITNIIYAKPICMHVKWYNLSLRHSSAISRSLWRANCKVRTWKEECVRIDSGGQYVKDFSTGKETLGVWEGGRGHIVLSLHVRSFWVETSHTVAHICRRFGVTSYRHPALQKSINLQKHVVFLALGTVNMWVVHSKGQEKISTKNLINVRDWWMLSCCFPSGRSHPQQNTMQLSTAQYLRQEAARQ